MPERKLIGEREERRVLGLAGRQPESAGKLSEVVVRLRERVVAVALADRKVQRRLAKTRYRVIGADYAEEKPTGRARELTRLAEVGFYDYDRDVLVVAVVNPRSGRVVRLEEREGLQPPPSEEEVEHARELALSDPRPEGLRGRRGLEVVAFTARAPYEERRDNHRRVHLYFWSGGRRPELVGDAVVDLSAERVVPATSEERATDEVDVGERVRSPR
ncbi:MAG: hypothetical protein M3R70_01195 [Actinomycetota bacterium]|nr:hypothetical protein [Actinomycetota bacterium]